MYLPVRISLGLTVSPTVTLRAYTLLIRTDILVIRTYIALYVRITILLRNVIFLIFISNELFYLSNSCFCRLISMADQSMSNPQISESQAEQPQSSGARKKLVIKRKQKARPEMESFADHNILAFLDEQSEHGKRLAGVIRFLKRSRIMYAISTPCTAYLEHIKEFWRNAKYDSEADRWLIVSQVMGTEIKVTPEVLREVLRFEGEKNEFVYHLNIIKVKGIFKRCHYVFDVNGKGTLKTNGLPPLYRYLAYVLNLCLSPKQTGHDSMRDSIQCAFAALVLNADFSFSKMTFDHIAENLTYERNQFLKFPRFLQMIINKQAPELPKEGLEEIVLTKMTDATLGKMFVYRKDADGNLHKPIEKDLICHLKRVNYQCPPNNDWRNSNSGSEKEDLGVEAVVDSDDEVVGTGAVPSQPSGSMTAGGVQVTVGKKKAGKRKLKKAEGDAQDDEDVQIIDLEDFLKENRKKSVKKVKVTGGTTSGSGTGENVNRPPPVQGHPQHTPHTGTATPTATPLIATGSSGAQVDVSEIQVDMRMMKENFLEMKQRQKKFEDEVISHYKSLFSNLKTETEQRLKAEAENAKLKEKVAELEVDMSGIKKYTGILKKRLEHAEKLMIKGSEPEAEEEAEGNEADDESGESDEEGGENDESTESGQEG